MEGDQSSPSRRKVKFAPRAPPTRKPKPKTPKSEAGEEDNGETAQARALLRHMSENLARRNRQVESKSNVQVAFGPGASSPPSLRTYGNSKGMHRVESSNSSSKVSGSGKDALTLPSAAVENQSDVCMVDASNAVTGASARKTKKEYREPWDYQSYYPTTLPLRKPYSGDPEILDEEEFGEAATNREYDEEAVNNAAELGLLDEKEEKGMLLFQFPALPLVKQSARVKGKEKVGTSSEASIKGGNLEDLSGGYMGKMLVYKSGAVKLKLGENLFDVSVGSDCVFAQDVVAMDIAGKNCCVLGELNKRAVVTPDDLD